MSRSLGMIEVKGLLGAIVAADTALKTADVRLIDQKTIRGGLTSVELFGDVGAITEAVYAAREATESMQCYISSNIIANLDPQVEEMIMRSLEKKKSSSESSESVKDELQEQEAVEEDKVEKSDEDDSLKEEKLESEEEKKETSSNSPDKKILRRHQSFLKSLDKTKAKSLSDLKVTELRSLAYSMDIQSLTKKEIKFANKKKLLEHLRREGDE